jgi:hypothetical protein
MVIAAVLVTQLHLVQYHRRKLQQEVLGEE